MMWLNNINGIFMIECVNSYAIIKIALLNANIKSIFNEKNAKKKNVEEGMFSCYY